MEEQRFIFLKSLKNVLANSDASHTRYQIYKNFVEYFEKEDCNKYISDVSAFRERMKEYEGFWTKYWTYRIFSGLISLPDFNEAKTNLLYLAVEFCLVQAIALSNFVYNQNVLTEEDYIFIISHVGRTLEHDQGFYKNLSKNMEEQGVVNLAGLLLMTFV